MSVHVRLALMLLRTKFAAARARTRALATTAWRAFTHGITCGTGIATSMLAALCTLVGITGCPAPTPANGAISIVWAIRAANGIGVTCASIGGRFVALRIRNRASGATTATAFPCVDGSGTAQLAPGLYDISFQLDAADGTRLATAPDQTGVTVVSGQVTQLAVQLIAATNPQTTLILSIATSASSNCQPTSAGGAGVTGTTLRLERVGSGCVPLTFTRQRGSEQRGTYTVDCSSPQVATCVEKDETLTTSLDPGQYFIHARGKVGVFDCWLRDDLLDIPMGTLPRTLGLMPSHTLGCPP
jgi:hypothetical protein